MSSTPLDSSTKLIAMWAGLVAVGVAVDGGLTFSLRTIPAVLLISIGLFGLVNALRDRPVEYLRITAKRWWLIAFVAFLPYGIAAAPSSERSVAVGAIVSESVALSALEAVAGAAILCAISITALYAMAWYGIHPGRPTPEERILNDTNSD